MAILVDITTILSSSLFLALLNICSVLKFNLCAFNVVYRVMSLVKSKIKFVSCSATIES